MEDFNLTNEKKITRKEWEEFKAFKEEYQENELQRNILLQRQNDILEGGIRSANLKEYRNTYCFNEADSLDTDNPFLMDFEVISEMTKIVSVKLSFKIKNFRAYSTSATEKEAVTSGPSSAESSASGGGQTPTTSAGGADTRTSSSKTTPSGGGDTSGSSGSASGGGKTTGYKGTPSGGGTIVGPASGSTIQCSKISGVVAHDGAYLITGYENAYPVGFDHTHTAPDHTHPSHYHTTPNHTHPSHYHSTPNHTHPSHSHTVTILNHYHTVTVAAHTHNIPHTHSVPAHNHDINFGIHEEGTSPTIQVFISRDNGLTYSLPLGSYTKDQDLDITRFIDTVGEKVIKFESDVRCRISARVLLKLDIKAR